jgi:hypothetical protein
MELLAFPNVVVRILGCQTMPDRKNFKQLPPSAQTLLVRGDVFPLFAPPVVTAISAQIEHGADPLQVLVENQFEFPVAPPVLDELLASDSFGQAPTYVLQIFYHSALAFLIQLSRAAFEASMHQTAFAILRGLQSLLAESRPADQALSVSLFHVLLQRLVVLDTSPIADHSHPLFQYCGLLESTPLPDEILIDLVHIYERIVPPTPPLPAPVFDRIIEALEDRLAGLDSVSISFLRHLPPGYSLQSSLIQVIFRNFADAIFEQILSLPNLFEGNLDWNSEASLPNDGPIQSRQDVPTFRTFPGRVDVSFRPQFPAVLAPDHFIPKAVSQVFSPITSIIEGDPVLAQHFVDGGVSCFAEKSRESCRGYLEYCGCLSQFLSHVSVSIPFANLFLSPVFDPKMSVFAQAPGYSVVYSVRFYLVQLLLRQDESTILSVVEELRSRAQVFCEFVLIVRSLSDGSISNRVIMSLCETLYYYAQFYVMKDDDIWRFDLNRARISVLFLLDKIFAHDETAARLWTDQLFLGLFFPLLYEPELRQFVLTNVGKFLKIIPDLVAEYFTITMKIIVSLDIAAPRIELARDLLKCLGSIPPTFAARLQFDRPFNGPLSCRSWKYLGRFCII